MAKSPKLPPTGSKAGSTERIAVNGGWVKRDERSGRLIEVESGSGSFRSSARSVEAVRAASEKREAALKRLADR